MTGIRRVMKLAVLGVLAATVSGCIVLPCGGRHGRYAQCNDSWRPAAHEGHGAGRPAPDTGRQAHS